MSLVRFSYSESPIPYLRNKTRHVYDLNQLLQQQDLNDFFESNEFDEMLHRAAQDDTVSFRNNKNWLAHTSVKALIFPTWSKYCPNSGRPI
ncbi:hypothetical protein [Siphonobacter sp. SORGH_AS_0500]|uniref:hypothetical protein n=1 Tax=Siphonobacter sp. SORGH_AS_0500 TaxID=1864824 RepID=UPI002100BAB0|nr:hypothetical protein [Siphonobacter sp. SORGH_AS_0500]